MFQIISLIAAFQALFFGILIITKKNKNMLDKYLFTWLLLLAINILLITVSQNGNTPYSSNFLYPSYILAGLHGFFLLLCTKSLMHNSPKDFHKEYSIFVAYLLLAVLGFFVYGIFPNETTIICRILSFCFNTFCIIVAVKLFHRYKMFLQANYSNVDQLSFNWIRLIAYGLITVLSGALILVVLHEFFTYSLSLYGAFSVIVLLFVNILGFRGIKHSTIFNQNILAGNQPQVPDEKEKSYTNYGLKEDDAVILSEQLKRYMETDKPYTNIDLSLKDLALALNTYPHYITQVLNTVFNQNFYDFINTYRIEEAKKRLLEVDYKNLTILAIIYDCGFNSKSTFNRIFKQKTGKTPSEYRNQ